MSIVEQQELRRWLTGQIAAHLGQPVEKLAGDVELASYGLDSVYALAIVAQIEDHFDIVLEPTIMWDNPSIDTLLAAITAELAATDHR